MSISGNARLAEQAVPVQATACVTLASTAGIGAWADMSKAPRMTIFLDVTNGTTVTAGDVTLEQATNANGDGAKALAMTRGWRSIDVAASQALAEFSITSNTFKTDTTNNKRLRYVLDVGAADLDVAGGFTHVRAKVANSANSVGSITYILAPVRYSGA